MESETTATYDAGDMGCGELVVALSRRMRQLPPDAVLELITRDPGSIEDIPAWCRMRGYELTQMDRNSDTRAIHFWIRKR
ncbi:sulfurtransferase TusA family protein [Sulfobacillus harzensis]|uniref:Sulfurtransferase TusA family protein n=1 Tax=Sulfobacillus harzensis TaxID=2729629 RepID=A0A7Y0L3Y7_9FIRM|nr:sulfurtransferase TusA family protein [Sulfobacillus harzensis]NMP22795.1 sulfurtransferase TusA family protein [Sulfobacillus harzensis]